MLTYDLACRVHDYLLTHGLGFCFTSDGVLVSREDCTRVIDAFNTLNA